MSASRIVPALAITMAASAALHAQQTGLTGKVTDVTGGALPGASVEVRREGAGTFHTVTNSEGIWLVPSLTAGDYEVTVSEPGFATVKTRVSMLVGQTPTLETLLPLAAANASVEVVASNNTIDTTSSAVAGNISPQEVQGVPINGRNYMSLATLVPGIKINAVTADIPVGSASESGKFQITMDGLQVSQDTAGSSFGQPRFSQDAISQFQIITNRFDATLGRSAGVYVNAQSKSGTNTLHGGAFGYFRNDALNAPDPIARNPITLLKPYTLPFADQQYGGTLGGPIKRDKMWYFGSFEGEHQPSTTTTKPIANGSASVNHPVILKVYEYLGKADYQINEKNHVLLRGDGFTYNNNYAGVSGTTDPSRAYTATRASYGYVADWNANLTPHFVNDLRAGFHHFGWQNLNQVNSIEIIFPNTTVGGPYNYPQIFAQNTQQYRDDIFWLKGKHSVKAGGEYLYTGHGGFFQQNVRGRVTGCSGTPGANGLPTFAQMFPNGTLDPTTWNFAAISTVCNAGGGATYVQGYGNFTVNVPRSIIGFWLQDDWKVLPRLTLNLGVRYDDDLGAFTGGPKLTNGLLTPSGNDNNNFAPRLGFAWDVMGDGKTSVRGGAGLYYADISANQIIDQQIFNGVSTIQASVSGSTAGGNPVNLASPFNGGNPATNPGAYLQAVQPLAQNAKVPYSLQASFGVQRQLPLKIMLTADFVHTRAYNDWARFNGNLLVDPTNRQRNLNPNVALAAATPLNCGNGSVAVTTPTSFTASTKQVCNQAFTGVNQFFTPSGSGSIYDGFQMGMRRVASKSSLGLAYTLSRTKNSTEGPFVYPNKPFTRDIKDEWGNGTDDQRHSLTVNGEFKFRYGLALSGLYRFGSGLAFATTTGTPNVNGGSASFNRTLPLNAVPIAPGTTCPVTTCTTVYAPLSHFHYDAGYGYWILARDSFRGAAYHRADSRLQETFTVRDRVKASVGVEVFNLFNHTNPYTYTTVANSSSYGQAASAGGSTYLEFASRQIQFLGRVSF